MVNVQQHSLLMPAVVHDAAAIEGLDHSLVHVTSVCVSRRRNCEQMTCKTPYPPALEVCRALDRPAP